MLFGSIIQGRPELKQVLHHSRNFNVVKDTFPSASSEKDKIIEYVEQPNVVIAVPITGEGKIILVEHKRPILDCTLIECPGGKVDDGELPEIAIIRELREEIGYSAENLTYISYFFTSVGTSTEKVHFFIAKDLISHERNKDDVSRMNVIELSASQALEKVVNNEIHDGKTIVALLRYFQSIGLLQQTHS